MIYHAVYCLAHALSDFVLQPDKLVRAKLSRGNSPWLNPAILLHSLVLLIVTALLLWWQGLLTGLNDAIALAAVTLLHYLIDCAKAISRRRPGITFLVDQLAHHVAIISVLILLGLPGWQALMQQGQALVQHQLAMDEGLRLCLLALAIIWLMWGSGYLVGSLLRDSAGQDAPVSNAFERIKRGTYIGYLERLLVLFFTFTGTYAGLGLVGTFKTLARFKQLDDRDFAEYYLYGTLLSFVLGLGFSLLFIAIWHY